MKRLSMIVAGLLVVGLTVFGCASDGSGRSGDWVTLLDGTNMKEWYPVGHGNWRIEDGAAVADKLTGKQNGFLVSNKSYTDFELEVEFWSSDNANSGIFMRCGNPMVLNDKVCYEANIFDQRKDPSYGTGAVVHIAKVNPMPKAGGKWNTYHITLKGDRIVLVFNGVQTVDVRDSKFKSGQIGLQYGAGVVKFRKVRIREL